MVRNVPRKGTSCCYSQMGSDKVAGTRQEPEHKPGPLTSVSMLAFPVRPSQLLVTWHLPLTEQWIKQASGACVLLTAEQSFKPLAQWERNPWQWKDWETKSCYKVIGCNTSLLPSYKQPLKKWYWSTDNFQALWIPAHTLNTKSSCLFTAFQF